MRKVITLIASILIASILIAITSKVDTYTRLDGCEIEIISLANGIEIVVHSTECRCTGTLETVENH